MEFVAQSIDENENEGEYGVKHAPLITGFLKERPLQQNREDKVLNPVTKFAYQPMKRSDIFGWNVGKQPQRDEAKEMRRICGGKVVRGKEKYQTRPSADG